MGKSKSLSYKRHLRKQQKKRKRDLGTSTQPRESKSSESSFRVNEDVIANPEPIQYENEGVSEYKLKLKEAVKYARQCESEVKALKEDLHRLDGDCRKKIRNVRYFWKDKIYGEGARSGKILKAAMQGSTVSKQS